MKIILIIVLSYLILILTISLFQRKILYVPSTKPASSVYEVRIINSGKLKINLLVDNPQREQAVIYFGGNAENVYAGAKRMQNAFTQRAAYYMNYPGYGGSSGLPSENTIIQAAKDVYAYVSSHHQNIALVGRSLGTGVAVKLAGEYPVSKLVLISPYDSLVALAYTHYPFFPARWLLKDQFDSVSSAENITAKILIILAAQDRVIPIQHSQNLIRALKIGRSDKIFRESVHVQVYQNADHNNVHLSPGFMTQIRGFLQDNPEPLYTAL